jgi:hypothetical protein
MRWDETIVWTHDESREGHTYWPSWTDSTVFVSLSSAITCNSGRFVCVG